MTGKTILITGAHGFIGSNLAVYLCSKEPQNKYIFLDGFTYAARPEYLRAFLAQSQHLNFVEEPVDINDHVAVARVMQRYRPEVVYHLAAESHVCRSITGPKAFFQTNVLGTFHMLEEFKQYCTPEMRFIHVSTDEVFGEIDHDLFDEESPIRPRSPYAASKAASDLVALSYFHTYDVPVIVTNCSNNFGPNQHEEKLVAGTITRLMKGEKVRVFGDGSHVRDWLFVEDHCEALHLTSTKVDPGERLCIGGESEMTNLEMVECIVDCVQQVTSSVCDLEIEFTDDRPSDDKRYAIDCGLAKQLLDWEPYKKKDFHQAMSLTVEHYLAQLRREASSGRRFTMGIR